MHKVVHQMLTRHHVSTGLMHLILSRCAQRKLAADLESVWGAQAVGTISRKRRHARSVTAEGDDHTLPGGEAAASVLKGQLPQRMH